MQTLLCSLMGYLVGNINPAYIIAKIKGFDIRKKGTGNAGASNAVIIMGKKAGAVVAIFDIFKAAVAVSVAAMLFPKLRFAKALTGGACILGHIFPFLMNFHGGKGLACLGGVILAYEPCFFLILLCCELILSLTFDYICIVPISGSMIFTSYYAFTTGDIAGTCVLSAVALVMLYKHIENIKRIQNGTEAHISFLWKKDQEIERIKRNVKG
ncbi:MAG: glycerol-3-phosphate acyltransferase [Ruminococcus sp.]|nr:glycerol-3-phosphate acyltransferase [Ruminococcus sp.]